MPQMTIAVTADLSDPADVELADQFIDAVRRAAARGAAVKLHAETAPVETMPEPTAVETPPSRARGRQPAKADAEAIAAKEFVVFKPDGERRAGYTISKDASSVLIFDAERLDTSADLTAFGKHNIPTIARLDKGDQERVQTAISAHVKRVKSAEAAADNGGAPSPEDKLAAAFSPEALVGTKHEAAETALSKDEFINAMIELSGQMGATASRAWITDVGFANPMDVPVERFSEIVAKGNAHVKTLKG